MPCRFFHGASPLTRSLRHKLCACGFLLLFAGAVWAAKPSMQAADPAHSPRPGYLGVSLRDLDAAEATRLGGAMPSAGRAAAGGALIVTVDRDAPAWTSGLRPGDVVLELNAQPVDNVEDLRRRLRECPAGDTVTLRIRRNERERSFAVPLGDRDAVAQNAFREHLRPAPNAPLPGSFAWSNLANPPTPSNPASPSPSSNPFSAAIPSAFAAPPSVSRGVASTFFDALLPGSPYTGLECDTLTPQLAGFFGVGSKTGLLVTGVTPGSPAALATLTAGDVILRAAQKPVNTRGALARALRNGKGSPVPLSVMRNHKELALSLQPGKRKKL